MLPFSYAVRNLWRRGARTLLTLVGIALITVLVILMAGFARGLSETAATTASPEVAVIVGSSQEHDLVRSSIPRGNASVVAADLPGVVVVNGRRAVSLELHVATRRGDQVGTLRGVEPSAFLVHERVTLVEGREPALPWELLAGRLAESRIGLPEGSLGVGRTVDLEGRTWTVSGRFAAPGTVLEAEMWGRLEDVLHATRREDVSSVAARLSGPRAMEDAALWVARRGVAYEVSFFTEATIYATLQETLEPIAMLAQLMAVLVLVGGVFACTNTMFAAVLARTREMGTLRALGYSPLAVGVSLVEESALLAAIGGLAGFFVAGLFGEVPLKFPMGAFYLDLTAPVRLAGLGAALFAGLLGGLVPAVRAIRMPLVDALGDKL
jgi:ABC-type antimicrobial peptide transport system permease subunit